MKTFKTITEIHPELIQIWETVHAKQPTEENPFIIDLKDEGKAISLRVRLYSARKKLLEFGYPNAVHFNRYEISTFEREGRLLIYLPNWIVASREAMEKVGVTPTDLPSIGMEVISPESDESPTNQEMELKKLFPAKGDERHE